MSFGWAHAMFDAADWDFWLLMGGVLVVCWGLVVAATATLFRSAAQGRLAHGDRRPQMDRHSGRQPAADIQSFTVGGAR